MLKKTQDHAFYLGVSFVTFLVLQLLFWTPFVQKGYVTWAMNSEMHIVPRLVAGLVLIGVFAWLARMAFRAKGAIGTLVFLTIFGLLIYWAIDVGKLPIKLDPIIAVVYACTSTMLAFGLRSARIGKDVSGQTQIEDADDDNNNDDND